MFNFFGKKKSSTSESEVIASITYLIKNDGAGPLIDVQMGEDDDQCVEALCSLLNILGSDMFYIETINMIRQLLIQSNQEDILLKILTKVNQNIRQKIVTTSNSNKEKLKDEPCIKPSDMLK